MVELMPHQLEAINNLANGKILWGGVGTGKSLTVLGYYMKNECPRDIVVITTAKKRDTLEWEAEAAKFAISTERLSPLRGTITIDSWNNIEKYVDREDLFFIFDEQRVVGSGLWVKTFIKIAKKNRWVLLSATPGDTWIDYIPVFVANGLYRNASQFKVEHVVYAPFSKYPRIVRYTGTATLEKYRNMVLVEMPYMMNVTEVDEEITTTYDVGLMKAAIRDRWHVYEDRPIREVGELFHVARKITNSDPSRLEALRELIKKHPKLIVFYNFNYELDALRTLSEEITIGEWNGHRKTPIPQSDRWLYLVQYTAGAEGWNCIETDSMVFYSLTYSYKNFVQARGRIKRLNTPFTTLFYYTFLSKSEIDSAVRANLDRKELFNERKWAAEMLGILGDWGDLEGRSEE